MGIQVVQNYDIIQVTIAIRASSPFTVQKMTEQNLQIETLVSYKKSQYINAVKVAEHSFQEPMPNSP